jgi:hypothetical protein
MSNGVFVLALTVGAGLLAMWLHARFPALAPERMGRAIVHAACAFVLLKLAAAVGAGSLTVFAAIFLLVLPALVYALLCTLWVLRCAQAALGISR